MIDLPIPDKTGKITLDDCIREYCKEEYLTGENAWFNEDKEEKQDAWKNTVFYDLPDVLIITLKRFSKQLKKNNVVVDYDLNTLDMTPYMYDSSVETTYELYGICNHSGGVLGGHYTAYIKTEKGEWYHFNDSHVSKVVQMNELKSSRSYCFFYKKK
mgnify:FL=1